MPGNPPRHRFRGRYAYTLLRAAGSTGVLGVFVVLILPRIQIQIFGFISRIQFVSATSGLIPKKYLIGSFEARAFSGAVVDFVDHSLDFIVSHFIKILSFQKGLAFFTSLI
jgi:hypothetical protein